MPYWQLFYHLIWATKNRQPLLTPDVEPVVYGFIRSKIVGLGGTLFALNGTESHVHVVTTIPPSLAVAHFIGQIKGVSATKFNKGDAGSTLHWQEEYGAFSFDGKRLPNFVAYVERQKQHHADHTTIAILERTNEGGVKLARETTQFYQVDTPSWADDLQSWEAGQ